MEKTRLIDKVANLAEGRIPEDEARDFEEFARQYYGSVAWEELAGREPLDVYGAARAHREFAERRESGTEKIRVYNPSPGEYGWDSERTVVEVVNDDMPFLVDSISAELNRHGFGIHLMIHPLMTVRRDREGRLLEMLPPETSAEDAIVESLIHVEVDRQTDDGGLQKLHDCLHRVLREVRAAVEDWRQMSNRLHEAAQDLRPYSPPADAEELEEIEAFLEWIDDHHFTFLGYREYELRARGDMEPVAGSGLGLLREDRGDDAGCPSGFGISVDRIAPVRGLVALTKGDTRATVHRPSYVDAVSVGLLGEDGEVVGERRFVGLYTSAAYGTRPWEVPLLRRKVARVLDRAGSSPASHDRKTLVDILENYPRDELLQTPEDDLLETALGILNLQERQRVRLFVRPDPDGRFVSCLLYLPRDWYDTQAAERVERVLLDALGGAGIERDVRLSESVLARVYFVVRAGRGSIAVHDPQHIEARVAAAVRPWADDLGEQLVTRHGEEAGEELMRRYGDAFPVGYRAEFSPEVGVTDVARLEGLSPEDDLRADLYRPSGYPEGSLRLKIYRTGGSLPLSRLVPLLENLGATVADERPYEVRAAGERAAWVYDLGLSRDDGSLTNETAWRLLEEALVRIWRVEAEDDGFNRLIPLARLDWRQAVLLRAYGKYLRQTGAAFSQDYMQDALAANPSVARMLVELFEARLDPDREDAGTEAGHLTRSIEAELEDIASLDEDRILRSFFSLVEATLRTNYFQTGADGEPKGHLSIKLDPQRIPALPQPRPMFETFVYSPRMEGVHLRGGRVARGGIRFSDRLEDFRTEILGLMKAQTVKNAVIVPVGAKGGFVVKQPPADGDREALREEGVRCYRTLIRGMLDITDNLDPDGSIVPPPGVVRRDGDDPYLVVAADKGTATFSDIANAVSVGEYGFWLGDAFASGGETGYDHKRMGITARGTWESVKRHFGELGLDPDRYGFTAVGIGDMSGDVFGNGMLLSRRVKLVGAFDHRHIFIDPDPDPEQSYAERERLFGWPRSSWADYDEAKISEGGGVFSRAAKSVPLSPEARELLDVADEKPTPDELISALLKAEVDMLWNGGIGTYVKASGETHADAGDRTNDPVRVDAGALRCRVVGEGGNLGFTQKGRIEFALAGGRINTDAVDNSAGVDCSDHEVNIKILLDSAVADGEMTVERRDSLLAEMTEEVADHVLADNREQNRALANAVAQSAPMVDVHARYLRALEGAGRLGRELEHLPDEEELARRKSRGLGLTSPELSVLLAHAKAAVYDELLTSDVPEDDYLSRELARYFPVRLRERFADRARGHRLHRELMATRLANEVVNRAGTTFVFRLGEETGASPPEVVRAYAAAQEVFGSRGLWEEIEALEGRVSPGTRTGLVLDLRRTVERATRWLLRNRRQALGVAAAVEYFSPVVSALSGNLGAALPLARREALGETSAELVAAGVPDGLAGRLSALDALLAALDVADVCVVAGETAEAAAAAYFALGDRLGFDRLRARIEALPREDLWQTLARAALRDDLDSHQAALTVEVRRAGPETDLAARLSAWSHANRSQVERALRVLAEVEVDGRSDSPSLSVAVREIRSLVHCGVHDPSPNSVNLSIDIH